MTISYIITPRYGDPQLHFSVSDAELEKHKLPIFLASNFLFEPLHILLSLPTPYALTYIRRMTQCDLSMIRAHAGNFTDKYSMPANISSYLLGNIVRTVQERAIAMFGHSKSFDMTSLDPLFIKLIAAGANPLFLVNDRNLSAMDMDKYLKHSPPGTPWDCDGFTLAFTHSHNRAFASEKLPLFLKYNIDINSIARSPNVGTALHVRLANEDHDQALAILRSSLVRDTLNPSLLDGEKKTISIIAAKVRSEAVLLELANLYPTKLAIDAQDDQGCTVLHYCFGLGLIEATRRYMALEPNLTLKDNKGRTAPDYLKLSPEETGNILKSIEIHPGRDAGAIKNSILVSIDNFETLVVNDVPQLATASNFKLVAPLIIQLLGDKGRKIIEEQQRLLRGISLLEDILIKRTALETEFNQNLIVPTRDASCRPSTPPPSPTS